MAAARRLSLAVVLVLGCILGSSRPARADFLIQNGSYFAGLWDNEITSTPAQAFGVLGTAHGQVGLENPTFFDPFGNEQGKHGTFRDAYGVSVFNGSTTVKGFVDPFNSSISPNIVNITSGTTAPTGAISGPFTVTTFLKSGPTSILKIDQTFSFPFSGAPNVLQDHTLLTNLTAGSLSSVQWRRITDFTQVDSSTKQPNTIASIPGGGSVLSTPLGATLTSVTPFSFGPFPNTQSADPTQPFNPAASGLFSTPGSYAAGLTLSLPNLAPFGTIDPTTGLPIDRTSFDTFFAVNEPGQSVSALEAELSALGLKVQFVGTNASSSPNANASGSPADAGFLTGIVAFEAIPEPATVALFGLGLAGLAGWRRWRKRPV
jgi:hypothetical protein